MNSVFLIGRLTRDPEVRYTQSQLAVARFSIAVDRLARQGEEKQTDFPSIVVFGKQAENCEKYLAKGRKVAIEGRLQTGSYTNKEGQKVYTTDVIANRVEFLEWGDGGNAGAQKEFAGNTGNYGGGQNRDDQSDTSSQEASLPDGFRAIKDDDIPF